MVSAAVRERLRKMRQKFHLGEYSNKAKSHAAGVNRRRHVVKHKRVVSVARRYGRRRSSGGMGGFGLKKLLFGAAIGVGAGMIPQIAPYNNVLTRAVAGYFVTKSIGGAASAALVPMVLGGSTAGGSGIQIYG